MKKKRVVVTGLGVISSLGQEPEVFYQNLLAGKSGIVPITEFPCEDFPTRFAGCIRDFETGDFVDKKQARRIDRCIAFALVGGKKALISAGFDLGTIKEQVDITRAGVIIGSGMGGMSTFFDNCKALIEKGVRRVSPFMIPYIITNMSGGLLAEELGFMGPNFSVASACATGNHAIIRGLRSIQQGETDLVVCGGVEAPISAIGLAGFCAVKALSERNDAPEKASRPWDKNRDGFVMGEGAGILVLESLEHALKRGAPIIAELKGAAETSDAYHMTEPRPDGAGVALCLQNALKDAGISPDEVQYVNAHATSTPVGDMAEIRALLRVFPHPEKIAINSTKSMIGHALGAAGGIEAVVTAQAIQKQEVHPTINQEDPEEIPFFMPTKATKLSITNAVSNSFGFGGHNACLVISRFE